MIFNRFRSIFLSVAVLIALLFTQSAKANEPEAKKEFNAGEMIIHHVLDAHEIHFFSVGETHVTLPLPVILYTKEQGFAFFMSNKFEEAKHEEVNAETHEAPADLTEAEEEGKVSEHSHQYASYGPYALFHEHIYLLDGQGKLNFDEHGHPTNAETMDFSITKTVFGMLIALMLLCFIFLKTAKAYTTRRNMAPKGIQSWMEPLVLFIRDEVAKPSIGPKYEKFMPYLLTVFFFILICNFMGLVPFIGGFNITGNIAVTMVLALITFIITSFNGNKAYWLHILWPPGVPKALYILLVPIEIMGVFIKPLVLMLRLFANITAGHIIILSFISLIFIFGGLFGTGAGYGASILSMAFGIFMNVMEILVAFLQAYVFTLLSALYFGSAIEEHHHAEEHH